MNSPIIKSDVAGAGPAATCDPISTSSRSHPWTIGAIAVVAYAAASLLHEGLGHGGACMLLGGRGRALNAVYFSYDHGSVSATGARFIAAAGGVANVVAGMFALSLLRFTRRMNAPGRYFLWLFAAVNLSMAFGYLLFSGVLGVGDWVPVFAGLAPLGIVRAALAVSGGLLYFMVAPRMLASSAAEFIDRAASVEPQEKQLMRLPYLVGGVLFVIASLPNPEGVRVILISAIAASFGGTSLLAWYPFGRSRIHGGSTHRSFPIGRSVAWIAGGVMTTIIFVGIFGRGISF